MGRWLLAGLLSIPLFMSACAGWNQRTPYETELSQILSNGVATTSISNGVTTTIAVSKRDAWKSWMKDDANQIWDTYNYQQAASNAGKYLEQAWDSLDNVEGYLEQWGHASISGFVLVPDHSGFFNLDYSIPMSNYVSQVVSGVQGQASFLSEKQTGIQLVATAGNSMPGLNVEQKQPAALTNLQQSNLVNQAIYQGQLAATNQLLQLALLQLELQQLTNANASVKNVVAAPTNAVTAFNPSGVATNASSGPTNTLPTVNFLITNITTQGGITNGFSPLGQLAGQMSNNQLSPTTILKIAATAKETERVLNFMSHPVDVPGNKQVFFAVGQISVMPGWRTKEDYICEVSTHFVYAGRKAEIGERLAKLVSQTESNGPPTGDYVRRATHWIKDNAVEEAITKAVEVLQTNAVKVLQTNAVGMLQMNTVEVLQTNTVEVTQTNTNWGSKYEQERTIYADGPEGKSLEPSLISLVAAFPFMESQVFDMQSSYRDQLNLLLNLAGSYVQAGYTVDANVLINFVKQTQKDLSTRTAFPTVIPGVESDMLTYRFDPEVAAMTDPALTEPQAGHLLLPTSIPVMILVTCDRTDVKLWPEISLQVETRWIPRERRSILADVASAVVRNRIYDRQLLPSQALMIAEELDNARVSMDSLDAMQSAYHLRLNSYDELRRRYTSLRTLGMGRYSWVRLPDAVPVVQSVSPTTIPADYRGKITLTGDYLDDATTNIQVLLGGTPLKVELAHLDTVEVVIDTNLPPLPAGINDLVFTNGWGSFILTQAVTVADATPVINSFSPTILPQGFNGTITISGQHLGLNTNQTQVLLGGFPLRVSSASQNTVLASVTNAPSTGPGTYSLALQNQFGSCVSGQGVTFTNFVPIVDSVTPTNFAANFAGTIIIRGQHFGLNTSLIGVSLGSTPLHVDAAGDYVIAATISKDYPPQQGTNNLVVSNGGIAGIATQAIVVTKAKAAPQEEANPDCGTRPPLSVDSISPRDGYVNGRTTFVAFGSNFAATNSHDPVVQVLVGGVAATNVLVVSDKVLCFDVPAWNNNGTNASPFPCRWHAANVVFLSKCQSVEKPDAVYFNLKVSMESSNAPAAAVTNAATQLIDKYGTVLKDLMAVETNITAQLGGSLRLEAGSLPSSTNVPASGFSPTVVIQNTSTNR